MLDFYLIADEQPNTVSTARLKYAGGVEYEEFELAQKMGIIESHADYYGKFRWSSQQVADKLLLLASCPFRTSTALNEVLAQAKAAQFGLAAFGD